MTNCHYDSRSSDAEAMAAHSVTHSWVVNNETSVTVEYVFFFVDKEEMRDFSSSDPLFISI